MFVCPTTASFLPMSGPTVEPPHAHILEEEVANEIVLYDSERELFVSLNPTASDTAALQRATV